MSEDTVSFAGPEVGERASCGWLWAKVNVDLAGSHAQHERLTGGPSAWRYLKDQQRCGHIGRLLPSGRAVAVLRHLSGAGPCSS